MNSISLGTFVPNASHFRITPSALTNRVTEAGSSFIFSAWIPSKFNSLLRVDEFNRRVQIAVVGQNTHSTRVTRCNTSDSPLSSKSSFLVCLQLMTADIYNLIVSIDGVAIPGMPCVGCIRVLPGNLDLGESTIEGFPHSLLAGTSCSFRIRLLDVFDNAIPLGDDMLIWFQTDSWVFISNTTGTEFHLYSNQTGVHTIRAFVNAKEFAFSPLTLRILVPEPSSPSCVTFLQSKDTLVTNQRFQVRVSDSFHVDSSSSLQSEWDSYSRILLRHCNPYHPRTNGSSSLLLFVQSMESYGRPTTSGSVSVFRSRWGSGDLLAPSSHWELQPVAIASSSSLGERRTKRRVHFGR